jgi:hypothetical protein
MAKVLVSAFIIFVAAWLVFAIWEIGGENDVIKAYSASTTVDRKSSNQEGAILPALLARSVTEYRVLEAHVVSRAGDFVSRYEDCEIFDRDNWSCTYSDDSAAFGFRSGDFFSRANAEKFPHLANYEDEIYLSRFAYVILGCRWDWVDGPIQMIACLFRPFAT